MLRALAAREGLGDRLGVDSAGTHGFHVGKPPDPRAASAARRRGIDLSSLRARRVTVDDFRRFDLVLAMDRDNLADLGALCPPGAESCLRLFLEFAPGVARREVPDPYCGGPEAFERMLDLIEVGARGLLDHLRRTGL